MRKVEGLVNGISRNLHGGVLDSTHVKYGQAQYAGITLGTIGRFVMPA